MVKMLDIASEYLEMGLSVIPLRDHSKEPCIYKWGPYQKRLPTHQEIETWFSRWPQANIGIVCGSVSGIVCVDADGPVGVKWIHTNMPKTSVQSITQRGIHALYKIKESGFVPTKLNFADEVDIKGEASYFVAPPSVHPSGHIYRWQFFLDGWEDLPEFVLPPTALPADFQSTKNEYMFEGVSNGMRNNSLAKLAGRWIGKDLSREEVFMLATGWNEKNSNPLPQKELVRTLNSIFKKEFNKKKVRVSKKKDKSDETLLPPDIGAPTSIKETLDDIFLHPGGILEKIMDHIEKNSAVSIPLFTLGAAITFLGAVAGQKFATASGLNTNIYSIVLGYSGTGKSSPFGCLSRLLYNIGATDIWGPTELTSSASILRWLADEKHHSTLMMLDEIGSLLRGLQQPTSFAADIPRILTKLFSSTDRPEIKSYANGDVLYVPWHHLALYGSSTPERFWDSLTYGDVLDGFLARILIWETDQDAPLPVIKKEVRAADELILDLKNIFNKKIEYKMRKDSMVPIPIKINMSRDAQVFFDDWSAIYHRRKNDTKKDFTGVSSIYARCAEHAFKLSLIHALSVSGSFVHTIENDSVGWATGIVDFLCARTVKMCREKIFINDIDRKKYQVLCFIREKRGVTLRQIQRILGRGCLSGDLKKILESLILSGEIKGEKHHKSIKYFLSNEKEN